MTKQSVLTAIIAFSSLCSFSQADSSRLKMQQGQLFSVDVTLNNNITQQAMGQAIDFTVDGKASHSYKVTNVSEDVITLRHEAQKMSFAFNGMGSKKTFDSENKKDIGGQWGEPVRKLLAKKYDVVIDAAGTVKKVTPESFPAQQTDERLVIVMNMLRDLTSVTEPPKKGDASFFKILPDQFPALGDTWTTQLNNGVETSTTIYKLESVTDSIINVSFQTKGKSTMKAQVMGMESTTSLNSITEGTALISKQTGILMEKKSVMTSTGTAEVMGNTTPVNAKTTVKVVVTPTMP